MVYEKFDIKNKKTYGSKQCVKYDFQFQLAMGGRK